ncbi:MAG: RNA-directed DNA polymerase [Thiotrichaceae bacterium]|nr:RNA-directed DNA polymerase [Thiotrichaceae bacterium]
MSQSPFSLQNLGLAYRKAKVDLYYSSHASLLSIADYESKLATNLQALQVQLEGDDEAWVKSDAFFGGWTLAPKSIECISADSADSTMIFSSPAEAWKRTCESAIDDETEKKPIAEFRLMAQCSLDFHVLSALWMLKVGHQYDKKLTDNACGNRLRRNQEGSINPLALGSFKPYLKPFRDWRDNGIQAMRSALAADKKIVALTADVSSFYHELNPGFMLNDEFNQLFELTLSKEEEKLHRLFINALQAWAQNTPLKKGLPVGLPASAVVANVALIELDRLIEQQVVPLYYGRYVDDLLLVMENGENFQSIASLWQWLFDRANNKLGWVDDSEKTKIKFQPAYLHDSQIHFANGKNKMFMLSGEPGKRLVESIANQIYQRASEWRALPNLPIDPKHVGTDLVAATQADGETADNLRKTDALTMRRAGFAIKLRDFEAYERDLPPEVWQQHRHAFFHAFTEHVLVLPHFFELALYLPRVIRLATACEDFQHLHRILSELDKLCTTVETYCAPVIKSCEEDNAPDAKVIMSCWKSQLFHAVQESIIAAFPTRLSKAGKVAWQEHMEDYLPSAIEALFDWRLSVLAFQKEQVRLFSYDLAHMPFRFVAMPKEMIAQRGIPAKKTVLNFEESMSWLPDSVTQGSSQLAEWTKLTTKGQRLPHGLLFATRPFNLTELFVLLKDPFAPVNQESLCLVVLALRGFSLNEKMPQRDKHHTLQIPDGKARPQQGVAVSSWKTHNNSWVASNTKTRPRPHTLCTPESAGEQRHVPAKGGKLFYPA